MSPDVGRADARPLATAPGAHRRRGGRGYERDRAGVGPHGHTCERLRHQERGRCSIAWPRPASTCTSATGPSTSRPTPTRSCTRPRSRARNVELVAARELGIPVLHRAAALAALAATRKTIAVAGSHGKTTSVVDARADPAQRGLVAELRDRRRGQRGRQQRRVRRRRVAGRRGRRERRHLPASLAAGRARHERRTRPSRPLRRLRRAGPRLRTIRRRRSTGPRRGVRRRPVAAARLAHDRPARAHLRLRRRRADYRIVDEVVDAASCRFTLAVDRTAHRIAVTVPAGVKASTNAAGAIAVALELGVDAEAAVTRARRPSVASPAASSTAANANGITFIDDYAHLPTEVGAAIAAARQGPWRRVVVVFQPHRYSRTASIGPQFADAFTAADALGAHRRVSRGRNPDSRACRAG